MLGHLGLSESQLAHKVVHRALAAGEDVQDLPAPRLGHGVEGICRRRCSCHAEDYMPI
jgi:hypothetical protein